MKLKKEIEQELREVKQKLTDSKLIPCGHYLYHCPNCGNPVLLNNGQNKRKAEPKQIFFCSSGHDFIFTKPN